MTERDTGLSKRLVVGHKRDGRACYDQEAKRELIEACLRSGISVARVALVHGINANLLRTWITRYQRQRERGLQTQESAAQPGPVAVRSAFVPVVEVKATSRVSRIRFGAQLPNGIKLDLSEVGGDDLSSVLQLLCTLPCSGSTRG
jgi:transposase